MLDLLIDEKVIDWGEYVASHVYTTIIPGTGAQVLFRIYDIYYPNNEGALIVEIYEKHEEELASQCATIPDGELYTSGGELITIGFDEWGYNYQGRIFNGGYCDAYRDAAWCQPYKDIKLVMKWNDAWLSNMDCDGDGLLDRHLGHDSYIGSGAWETNTMTGTYESDDGELCHWSSFTKIVAVPADAYTKEDGYWYTADGNKIGQQLWGSFAVIFDKYSDSCTEEHGVLYRPDAVPIGFGFWDDLGY